MDEYIRAGYGWEDYAAAIAVKPTARLRAVYLEAFAEWLNMARNEFSRKTRLEAWQRADGRCEKCGKKIRPGDGPEYDHRVTDFHGGANDLANCQVLCIPCHGGKTNKTDKPAIAKSKRMIEKMAKASTRRRGFRGGRRFNGEPVWYD